MDFDIGNTLIERDKWEEIRRKLYFPELEDEYKSSSKCLTDFTKTFLSEVLPHHKQPLKEGYVADLCRDGSISPCALILGLIYIQRLAQLNPAYLCTVLPSDLFLTAMVVASKYLQDEGESEALVNSEWCVIGQKKKIILDKLEKEFLNAIDWNLYVYPQQYNQFTAYIEGRIACMEASRRGWWSYTDLVSYWNTTPTTDLMASASSQTAKVVSGSMATYLLCFTALVSASNVTMETSSTSLVDPNFVPSSNHVLLDANTNTVVADPSSLYHKVVWNPGFERVGVGMAKPLYDEELAYSFEAIKLGDDLAINGTQINKQFTDLEHNSSDYWGRSVSLESYAPYKHCICSQEYYLSRSNGFHPATISPYQVLMVT